MTGVFVERAVPADAAELARLQALCHSHPWTLEQVAAEIGHGPPGAVLVARAGRERRIRAACAYRVSGGEMEVLDVSVDPEWRRKGLARRLVRLAIARAGRARARAALLEVRASNAPARSLYASLGFRERGIRRGYYSQPAEDAIVLEMPISVC